MKKKNVLRARIVAVLGKLGPSSPRQILDKVGGNEARLSYHLRAMKAAGLLKATGTTSSRVYSLKPALLTRAESSFGTDRTPPQERSEPAPIAAITADRRLVLWQPGSVAEPTVLPAAYTPAIADLLKAA